MNYRELNILNTLLVAEPDRRLPPLYCPRDEIASPQKLSKIINKLYWDGVYTHNNRNFTYINVPWNKTYSNGIKSSNFYVLSNYIVMFNTVHTTTNWVQWLRFWGLKPFLITTPIFHTRQQKYISKFTYPETAVDVGYHNELDVLIANRSYTIANGYIFFLALYRKGIIPEEIVLEALRECYTVNYYQEVHYEWQDLYYGHDIPHIADFPWYYGTSELTENILNILMPNTFGFEFILSLNNYLILPTFQSTMFPNLNTIMWDKWKYDKWIIDYIRDDCRIIPDIPGFIHSVIKNKFTWEWWNSNKKEYISRMSGYYGEIFVYIFYKLKNTRKYSERNRLMHLYRDIINNCDGIYIKYFLEKYLLKQRLNNLLKNRYSYYEVFKIPSEFIMDCLKIQNINLQIFDDRMYRTLNVPVKLLIANDKIQWKEINLYKFIRLDKSVKKNIDKVILHKLCCIYKYFGLFKKSDTQNYIGVLLLEYLKKNIEYLIF